MFFADVVNALVVFALQIDFQSSVFIWSDAGAVKSIALSGNGINKRYFKTQDHKWSPLPLYFT